ncbi:hypothetical protein BC940DRAFT_300359 [Gongronella butleri]|nr:hypothetical protein BC940DRAFT_300359 [Gongronella butleri]
MTRFFFNGQGEVGRISIRLSGDRMLTWSQWIKWVGATLFRVPMMLLDIFFLKV